MSELINNSELRQKVLKELIRELHDGKSVDEVKARFANLIQGISVAEISAMEQGLINEGLPVGEVQRLCDVHASVFKGSIAEIHRELRPEETPGHPVHTFQLENKEIAKLLEERVIPHLAAFTVEDTPANSASLKGDLELLGGIDKHYSRKENLLFPYLEKYGITAPPKVMWGVDDEIRAEIKKAILQLTDTSSNRQDVAEQIQGLTAKVTEMIFKEENILFPMVLETLTQEEWLEIARESGEFGFFLIKNPPEWQPEVTGDSKKTKELPGLQENSYFQFATGLLTLEQVESIFNHLPVDITFVDREGIVKYFSQSPERIFPRPTTVIGRQVKNCHPPASVHIVEKILADFQEGRKDHEDFWIKMGNKYVYIRYFAVRSEKGDFLGTLEVTQNIKPIQELTGEKRLLAEPGRF